MLKKRGYCCSAESFSSEKKLKSAGKECNNFSNGVTNGVSKNGATHDRTKEETALARKKFIA